MTITSNFRTQPGNWIRGTVALDGSPLNVHAKVFTEPSGFGMAEDARISKLWVATPDGTCLYNYDRGLDTDHLTAEGLALIVAAVAEAMSTEETHRHELGPVIAYGWTHADDPLNFAGIPTTTYQATCEALEPHHDPHIEQVELVVLDGATWAACPNCREHIRVNGVS